VGSAADPPSCDSQGYPVAFLRINGSIYVRNTRYIKVRLNPKAQNNAKAQSDPEYPFPLTVAPSNGASHTFTVRSYPKDQFPVSFAKGETDQVTAKYVEVHTSYGFLGTLITTRCTRTLSATFRAPPRPRAQPRGGSGRGPNRGGGRGRDDDDQGQHERDRKAGL
jgi:hypothetical protein